MKSEHPPWRFSTVAARAGWHRKQLDVVTTTAPIVPSVTYLHPMRDLDAIFGGEQDGFVYTRYGNPTVGALEEAVAMLEGGEAAVGFATGMAAVHAALLGVGLKSGDVVVCSQDVYGATYSLLGTLFARLGVKVVFVEVGDLASVKAAVARERPKIVWVETVSNPLLRIADLAALAAAARGGGAVLMVDGTFTPPYLCRPLDHGADLVIHSATKYLGGHGDAMGGLVVGSRTRCDEVRTVAKLAGGTLGPFDAWLILRGLKTLTLRVRRQCENAFALAEWLSPHPRVAKVIYPGLPSHPHHTLAKTLLREGLFGAMVAFELKNGTREQVMQFMDRLQLCLPATTLGDIYTEVLYPPMSSHRWLSPEERRKIGIGDGFIRVSVGIEAIEDIAADFDQALASR
jgi:cystathionine beta-lyase/cystathionine gamma-synthase